MTKTRRAGSAVATPSLARSSPSTRSGCGVGDDLDPARDLSGEDSEYRAMAADLEEAHDELADQLRVLLPPTDPNDDTGVILEVEAGEGGEESALFACDLLRMYLRYAERQGWKTEVLDATESDLGG
jgi:peptide chain release factor 1